MISLIRRVFIPGFVFLALSGCKNKAEPEPILIGHVAPLSGPDKLIGDRAKQAILLAVNEVNKDENRIAGRRVAVLHVDPHGDPDALQPEAVRLITINRVVALLGGLDAAQVERLGHAAQPYDVALVTPAELPAEPFGENVFSVNAGLAFHGQVLARFAVNELKAERVTVLTDGRRVASTALADAFTKEFSRAGGQAAPEAVYKNEADLAKSIEASKTVKPQAILYAGAAADLAKVRAALQSAGLPMPVLFGGDGEHLAALEADPKASDGIYLATPYVLEGGTAEFAKRYQAQFQESPGTDALLAYDGVRVLFEALRRAKLTSAAKVRAELATFMKDDFESLAGRIVFNKDHSARRPLFVGRLEKGRVQSPKRFDPEAK